MRSSLQMCSARSSGGMKGAMATREQIETIADACLEADEEIKKYGSREMQTLMRLLLFQIGQELAHQQSIEHEVIRGPWVLRAE